MDDDVTCILECEEAPMRPLPEGKQYHVFFSYKEEDEGQEWIRIVTNELKTKYGYRCCNHELDFQPGKKIVENIKDCIRKSVKTAVVLTKGYTESFWCQMELELIIQTGINRKEQIIIPICKEDLTEMPDYLPVMTCIYAKGPIEEWIHRLVLAIESPVNNVTDSCFTQHFLQNSNFKTLDIIYEESTRAACTRPPFQTRFIPDYLKQSGINLSPEIFSNIFKVVSENRLVRQRMIMNPWWPVSVCWFLTVPSFFSGTLLTAKSYFEDMKSHSDLMLSIAMLLLFGLFGVTWPLFCFISNKKGKLELKRELNYVNRILMQHNIFVSFITDKMTPKVTIYFIYYNIQSCVNTIQSRLNSTHCDPSFQEIVRCATSSDDDDAILIQINDDGNEQQLQSDASEVILKLSQDYFEDFLNGRIGYHTVSIGSERSRHSSRAMCFCEYAELKKNIFKADQPSTVITM